MQKENVKSTSIKKYFLVLIFCLAGWIFFNIRVRAEVTDSATNTAFRSGETVQYDLYYNWKFVWVKAGSATMNVTSTVYQGLPAYRTRILTRGSVQADKFWVLRDTLTSIMTHNLLPLAYTKTDLEGKSYRVRNVWYTYKDGKTYARQEYINPYGAHTWKTQTSKYTIYDMASILMRARSLDASQMKPGYKIQFIMSDGDGLSQETLIFRGRKNVKMKNGSGTYCCIVVSFVEYEKGKEKEVATFYVTNDANHLPVACDLYLRIGSAKIFMSGYKNLRNPCMAKVQ